MVHLDYKNSSHEVSFMNVKFVIKCDVISDVGILFLVVFLTNKIHMNKS